MSSCTLALELLPLLSYGCLSACWSSADSESDNRLPIKWKELSYATTACSSGFQMTDMATAIWQSWVMIRGIGGKTFLLELLTTLEEFCFQAQGCYFLLIFTAASRGPYVIYHPCKDLWTALWGQKINYFSCVENVRNDSQTCNAWHTEGQKLCL